MDADQSAEVVDWMRLLVSFVSSSELHLIDTFNRGTMPEPTETTSLLPTTTTAPAASQQQHATTVFVVAQGILLVFFCFGTEYSVEEYQVKE